jgi:hypothetical protein
MGLMGLRESSRGKSINDVIKYIQKLYLYTAMLFGDKKKGKGGKYKRRRNQEFKLNTLLQIPNKTKFFFV